MKIIKHYKCNSISCVRSSRNGWGFFYMWGFISVSLAVVLVIYTGREKKQRWKVKFLLKMSIVKVHHRLQILCHLGNLWKLFCCPVQ